LERFPGLLSAITWRGGHWPNCIRLLQHERQEARQNAAQVKQETKKKGPPSGYVCWHWKWSCLETLQRGFHVSGWTAEKKKKMFASLWKLKKRRENAYNRSSTSKGALKLEIGHSEWASLWTVVYADNCKKKKKNTPHFWVREETKVKSKFVECTGLKTWSCHNTLSKRRRVKRKIKKKKTEKVRVILPPS
jgi:hypothetical protein